jgi:protein SCO1/2
VNNHTRRPVLIALLLAGTFLFSSCHRSKTTAAKRYPFTGRVLSIDMQDHSAVIDGDTIPGFMDAMAMSYQIKPPSLLSQLSPGDTISAELVDIPHEGSDDNGAPDSWLENIRITGHASPSQAAAANPLHMPAPGEDVPDFSFTNQAGKRISLKQYRGKVLLVTFIYTRCPFPDFCPRVSGNFAEIYQQLGTNPALAGTHLLSVSFDPEHDTPKVLRNYGYSVAHSHDSALFSRWEFAAPAAADLPRIADFFALTIKPEGGMITHTLSTAVIGPDGKIVKWYHGSDWQPSDLIKDAAAASAHENLSREHVFGKGTASEVAEKALFIRCFERARLFSRAVSCAE